MDNRNLMLLPLGLPGKVYRSPMPFSSYDEGQTTWSEFLQNDVSVIVLLTSDWEARHVTGVDLKAEYEKNGFTVIHLPVEEFGAAMGGLELSVTQVEKLARGGANVAIHCHAGCGRTGLFGACLARQVLGLSGRAAIRWMRQVVPCSIESLQQEQQVRDFQPASSG